MGPQIPGLDQVTDHGPKVFFEEVGEYRAPETSNDQELEQRIGHAARVGASELVGGGEIPRGLVVAAEVVDHLLFHERRHGRTEDFERSANSACRPMAISGVRGVVGIVAFVGPRSLSSDRGRHF